MWVIENHTPFSTFAFVSRDPQLHEFGVFILRGTFEIVNGGELKPLEEQEPICVADVPHNEPNQSSLYFESDIAPFKPAADIMANAIAWSPSGRPKARWTASIRVGNVCKEIVVTGPRHWQRHLTGWKLTPPEPVESVPVMYELAFGGSHAEDGIIAVCEDNPVGRGWVPKNATCERLDAPQIESPNDPVQNFGQYYQPQGLGPITRSWRSRLRLAGTFDERWKEERWPELPEDYDYARCNAAHPDLIYPGFLIGNESVELLNLHPNGPLGFVLPGYHLVLLSNFKSGLVFPSPLHLDTLMIDVPTEKAYLTWRARFPMIDIAKFEVRGGQTTRGNHG